MQSRLVRGLYFVADIFATTILFILTRYKGLACFHSKVYKNNLKGFKSSEIIVELEKLATVTFF